MPRHQYRDLHHQKPARGGPRDLQSARWPDVHFSGHLVGVDLRCRGLRCGGSQSAGHREGFAARLDVLPYHNDAAAHTGQLRAELKKVARPIGPYDEMIAGHARSQGLVVVTNNAKPFENVPGIRLTNWVN